MGMDGRCLCPAGVATSSVQKARICHPPASPPEVQAVRRKLDLLSFRFNLGALVSGLSNYVDADDHPRGSEFEANECAGRSTRARGGALAASTGGD